MASYKAFYNIFRLFSCKNLVHKKHEYFVNILKSLAISIQYDQGIILLKGDIHRFVSSIEQFLSDLRGPRNCRSNEVNFFVGHPVCFLVSQMITLITCKYPRGAWRGNGRTGASKSTYLWRWVQELRVAEIDSHVHVPRNF